MKKANENFSERIYQITKDKEISFEEQLDMFF